MSEDVVTTTHSVDDVLECTKSNLKRLYEDLAQESILGMHDRHTLGKLLDRSTTEYTINELYQLSVLFDLAPARFDEETRNADHFRKHWESRKLRAMENLQAIEEN